MSYSYNSPSAHITDKTAMDDITTLLSGEEWSTDTLADIATVVRLTGRKIRDVDDDGEEEMQRRVEAHEQALMTEAYDLDEVTQALDEAESAELPVGFGSD